MKNNKLMGITKVIKISVIFLGLAINFSCVEKQSSLPQTEISRSVLEKPSTVNTLKFTSGIRSILQDSQGNYWFGSLQEGLCLFDGETFSYFDVQNGLIDNQVRNIREDASGTIWLETSNGVCSYDKKQLRHHSNMLAKDLPSQWMKTDKDLWFSAGNNAGVYRYDGRAMNYLAFPDPKVINPTNVYFVTDIAEGKNDMLWMATYAGIFGYNGQAFTIINDETLGFKEEGEYLHIRNILEDTQGRLWIGNNGIGVLLYDGNSTINFSDKMGLIHADSKGMGDQSPLGTLEHVFTIAEDAQGNIWFGDRDAGVWKYDGVSMINYTIKDGLSDNFASAIYQDRNGELWFGLGNGDLYTFNGKSFDKKW